MEILSTSIKNKVLSSVKSELLQRREEIIRANGQDLKAWQGYDQSMYDRLIVNEEKIASMVHAIEDMIKEDDPVGQTIYSYVHPNGLHIENRTIPFGSVMIIYESRPDVTVEAAMVTFKSNNMILLKGGKEALYSNRILVDCWHQALESHGLSKEWVQLLEWSRQETQAFLKNPHLPLDLIVPRGGEGLINFVKNNATCPVLVSGRGNNFMYIHEDAIWHQVISVAVNAKTDKISACNALDKILINQKLPNIEEKISELITVLENMGVQVILDESISKMHYNESSHDRLTPEWGEEYLAMKIAIGLVDDPSIAVKMINDYSGGHSAIVMTADREKARHLMDRIDVAAVYHNASSRFTDGGQYGMAAELAISTDKLHHRGPLGLRQMVTNKWYIYGDGQIRK